MKITVTCITQLKDIHHSEVVCAIVQDIFRDQSDIAMTLKSVLYIVLAKREWIRCATCCATCAAL